METNEIIQRLEEINKNILKKSKFKNPEHIFYDNQEFLQIMNISKRTCQIWRDKNVIPYSQIGAKIYYKLSDILTLLENHKK